MSGLLLYVAFVLVAAISFQWGYYLAIWMLLRRQKKCPHTDITIETDGTKRCSHCGHILTN